MVLGILAMWEKKNAFSNAEKLLTKLLFSITNNLVKSIALQNYLKSKSNKILKDSIWLVNSAQLKSSNSSANFFALILILSIETDLWFNIQLNKSLISFKLSNHTCSFVATISMHEYKTWVSKY